MTAGGKRGSTNGDQDFSRRALPGACMQVLAPSLSLPPSPWKPAPMERISRGQISVAITQERVQMESSKNTSKRQSTEVRLHASASAFGRGRGRPASCSGPACCWHGAHCTHDQPASQPAGIPRRQLTGHGDAVEGEGGDEGRGDLAAKLPDAAKHLQLLPSHAVYEDHAEHVAQQLQRREAEA